MCIRDRFMGACFVPADPGTTGSLINPNTDAKFVLRYPHTLSLIHISEPTRLLSISYAVFCLKKKNNTNVTLLTLTSDQTTPTRPHTIVNLTNTHYTSIVYCP